MWPSLPHFVYNSIRSSTQLPLARRTQLNYIIVRRPLDLWNRMFNRHQAEITVMQFTGHSLPVHHSVVYHGNYLVPFHQPISAHAISSPNCHWNVSLPSGASPWNSIFGGRVEGQNITYIYMYYFFMYIYIYIYTISHLVRFDMESFYSGWARTNRDSCVATAKILDL